MVSSMRMQPRNMHMHKRIIATRSRVVHAYKRLSFLGGCSRDLPCLFDRLYCCCQASLLLLSVFVIVVVNLGGCFGLLPFLLL